MSFGGLELHGRFDIFFLGVNRSGPKRVQHPITYSIEPRDDFMVHGVKNPSSPVYTVNHGRWSLSMVRLDSPTFMVPFLYKNSLQSL